MTLTATVRAPTSDAPLSGPLAAPRLPNITVREGEHPPLSFERQRLNAWLGADQLRTYEHHQLRVSGLHIVSLYTDHGTPHEDETEGKGMTLDAAIADALRIFGYPEGEMPGEAV